MVDRYSDLSYMVWRGGNRKKKGGGVVYILKFQGGSFKEKGIFNSKHIPRVSLGAFTVTFYNTN